MALINEGKYANKISKYSDEQLQKMHVAKTRMMASGGCVVVHGLITLPVTMGLSIIPTAMGWFEAAIAEQKQILIKKELESRSLKPRTATAEDYVEVLVEEAISSGIETGLSPA